MARSSYDRGDKVHITGTFTNASGTYIDPSNVYLQVVTPAGVHTDYAYPATISRTSSGVYYHDLTIDQIGAYYYRVHASGIGQAAAEGSFTVKRSKFA